MAKTPLSGDDPYCSGADFLLWYDIRTVKECLSDDDLATPISDGAVPTNPKLVAILQGASGKLEAAVMMGGKYTPTDLATLTGNSLSWMKSIVADLAAPKVLGRRFTEFPDFQKRLEEAEGVLVALSKGELIFGLQENVDAGILDSYVETPTDVEEREMITYQARQYFGRRANRSTRPTSRSDDGL